MTGRQVLQEQDVIARFEDEFASIKNKFWIHRDQLQQVSDSSDPPVNSPGIYVHWRRDLGVIKVGKSQSNSKERALEHIRANTKNEAFEMKKLQDDPSARLILFNILSPRDMHWLLSLEAFLEWNCDPLIPSGRTG